MKKAQRVNLNVLAQDALKLFKEANYVRAVDKLLAKERPAFEHLERKVQSALRRNEAPDQWDEWNLSTLTKELGVLYQCRSAAIREIACLQHKIGESPSEVSGNERAEGLDSTIYVPSGGAAGASSAIISQSSCGEMCASPR